MGFFLFIPWRAGETQQETDSKFAEIKAMTKERFADGIVEVNAGALERTKYAHCAGVGKGSNRSKSEDQV